jgi:ring-1,2-phenylacetyl-CoA epoxidase subunit PaaC
MNEDAMKNASQDQLFEYCLLLGDDLLVLGHRLSEWCGHAPILEEDIALTNIALDCVGQASNLLSLAAEIKGGTTSDELAYFREAVDYRNCLLVEQPNGDFASTVVRQFLFDVYSHLLFDRLKFSTHLSLAGISQKAVKEIEYHLRHSSQWILRLGDGTDESQSRAQRAVNDLWRFTGELFETDGLESALVETGKGARSDSLKSEWTRTVEDVLSRANLSIPAETFMQTGGRRGLHTEHLGHMLAEMQIVARSFPEATW